MSPDTVVFIDTFSKLAAPTAIILAFVLIGWRILPTLLTWWKAQTEQANEVKSSLPGIEQSLHRMAEHSEASESLLREINKTQDRMNAKLDLILERK